MKYFLLITICFACQSVLGQTKLPVVRATSPNVAIDDGGYLDKDAWTLSPRVKPDVYTAGRSLKAKTVAFYTDIDSVKFTLQPGQSIDFIILLDGKDSCYTRVQSDTPLRLTHRQRAQPPDTIPFHLNEYDAIQVKCTVNDRDTLDVHFDLGTLDIRLAREVLDRYKTEPITAIRFGDFVAQSPTVQVARNASFGMQGRFGWRVFDGRVVEIDYDHRRLVVYPKRPRIKKGFVKSDIRFAQSLLCAKATIPMGGKKYEGDFLFDTGANMAIILDSAWMRQNKFPDDQPLLKKSYVTDGAGRKYETRIVMMPAVEINGFVVKEFPASKLGFKSPVGLGVNYFGNELLKRFNLIIDLQRDQIYLKPNSLYHLPFKAPK